MTGSRRGSIALSVANLAQDAKAAARRMSRTIEEDGLAYAILEPQKQRVAKFLWGRTRIAVVTIAMMCLSLVMANSLALNFTILCMTEPDDELAIGGVKNASQAGMPEVKPRPIFTPLESSWLFSAIAIGTIIGTIPISYLSSTFGVRKSFMAYGLLSGVSTLVMPLIASFGFGPVFVLRVLQGMGVSFSYPAMGSVIAEWSPLQRSGMYIAYLSIHLQLGSVIVMPLSGMMCGTSLGWQGVYYLLGGVTLVLFAIFYSFYKDSAAKHRLVSPQELAIITKGKEGVTSKSEEPVSVPYRAIFTDKSVIGAVVVMLSSNLGFNLFAQYGPTFLNRVLHFDLAHTGLVAAMPPLICIFVKFLAGPASDRLPGFSPRGRIIVFATFSQVAMGCCSVTLAFLPEGAHLGAQIFYTGAIVASGLNAVGVTKGCQLISGRFAFVIMALYGFSNSCIVLVLPMIVSYMAPDHTRDQWARLLILVAIIQVVAVVIFDFTARAEPRKWALRPSSSATVTVAPYLGAPEDIKKMPITEVIEETSSTGTASTAEN